MSNEMHITEHLARLAAVLKARGVLTQVDCDFISGDIDVPDWLAMNDDNLHIEEGNE